MMATSGLWMGNRYDSDIGAQIDPKKENKSQNSEHTLGNSSGGKETKHEQHSYRISTKDGSRERGKTTTEKENKPTVLLDARVRHLKDQLIRAKVYLSLSVTRNNPHFIRELQLRMKEVIREIGDATKDSELPKK
ncbi:unnamed protein product [Fraxinus pennsylvanica]|uniref:Uncharacterized protein n=1 Tax=Fraxinus pennsylvanica TaxID=56036 RepID=A0AAD1YPU7_9LAMI|nr:unnamed protein product [Fraxinus pennsylvanica]